MSRLFALAPSRIGVSVVAVVLAGVLGSGSALADFITFDDFDSYTPDSQLIGQGPAGNLWTQTKTAATKVMVRDLGGDNVARIEAGATDGAAYRSLTPLGLAIPNTNSAATVFFQATLSATTPYNWNFIVTDVPAPADTAGSSEVQLNCDTNGTNPQTFRIRSAGAFKAASTDGTVAGRVPLVAGATYNVWFEIDNTLDKYRVYMQSDEVPVLAARTQVLADDGTGGLYTFRNSGSGAQPNDLITVNFGAGGTNNSTAADVDNIFVDTAGFNAANPVPEPTLLAMLLACAAALVIARKRFR